MNRTNMTLIEQMKISDSEINERKKLLDLTSNDIKILTEYKGYIEDNIEFIVDEFYEQQTEIDEIVLLIGDADTLRRLHTALKKYILDVFSGYYDNEYVNNRLRIGIVHKRIGVEPKLYLSAIRILKTILIESLKSIVDNQNKLSNLISALDKVLYFDITLVFDTYIDSLISEIETAKQKTEKYSRSLEDKVQERTKQLEELSRVDPLTGLFNQRAMYDFLRSELASAKRGSYKLSIIYFDLDKFKQINDKEGHIKGDEVLKKIGNVLQNTVREVDIACRYGGDEFVVLLPNCDVKNAVIVCEKIITAFNEKYPQYSFSMGIADTGTDNYLDGSELIKVADEKMYLAKKEDGSQIRF